MDLTISLVNQFAQRIKKALHVYFGLKKNSKNPDIINIHKEIDQLLNFGQRLQTKKSLELTHRNIRPEKIKYAAALIRNLAMEIPSPLDIVYEFATHESFPTITNLAHQFLEDIALNPLTNIQESNRLTNELINLTDKINRNLSSFSNPSPLNCVIDKACLKNAFKILLSALAELFSQQAHPICIQIIKDAQEFVTSMPTNSPLCFEVETPSREEQTPSRLRKSVTLEQLKDDQ